MSVRTVHFQPASTAGWLAVVAPSRLLVLGDLPDAGFADDAWRAIAGPGAFASLLDLMTRNGLAATPSFALAEWDADSGAARIVVRGEVMVRVEEMAGEQTLSGVGVSTWVERVVTGMRTLALEVQGAVPVASVGELPLSSGTAWIAALTVGGSSDDRAIAVGPIAVEPVAVDSGAAEPVTAPAPVAPVVEASVGQASPTTEASPAEVDLEATRTDAPALVEEPAGQADGYDYLFGDTMYRSVAEAAVHLEEPSDPADAPSPDEPSLGGDHDGHTVLTSDIAKLRGKRRQRASTPPLAPAQVKSMSLLLSSGVREPLTQTILVGRSPSVSQVSGGRIPRLVTVGGADQDISRTHAQFVLEGDTVVVTDLHSRNGTFVVLPGKSPQKLRAGEPTSVIAGTVVDLGGGVTLTVEED